MAGRVTRVVPKTFVTFSNIPAGSPALPTWLWLARRVPIQNWREFTLYVRLHPSTVITNINSWALSPRVQVYADGFTDEDPAVFATNPPSGNAMAGFVAQLGSDLALPAQASTGSSLTLFNGPANSGGLIAIAVCAKQPGAGAQTGDLYISIDLSGKE